jgi:tRNA threonylcarbamoyladenosine biosynthesis protein TsaE
VSDRPARTFVMKGPGETRRLGEAIGRLLKGDEVIHLTGGLGAGKTCLVTGLCRGLGAQGPVASPTFTLINEYPGPIPLFHVDLYRLERPGEIVALGLEEYFGNGVVAVEWAERLPSSLASPDFDITLEVLSDHRRLITVRAAGEPLPAGLGDPVTSSGGTSR